MSYFEGEYYLTKRLKKRIEELCGFNNLDRNERVKRANDILKSAELKQAICKEILGTSFKDVEKVMNSILKERKITQEQQELLELEENVPEKFNREDVEFNSKISSPKEEDYFSDEIDYEYRMWIQTLVSEYFSEQERKRSNVKLEIELQPYWDMGYDTYSQEEVLELLKDYSSSHYKKPE